MPHTHPEPHNTSTVSKLNWLRAAVLGANDGIVSIAGLVVGVAGATESARVILAAGMAGVVAGAISMAAGEYVSVSSSRDTERALLKKERRELRMYPEAELEELIVIYERKGLSRKTATAVAKELTEKDAFNRAVDGTAIVTRRLLHSLVINSNPRDREVEAQHAHARAVERFGTAKN